MAAIGLYLGEMMLKMISGKTGEISRVKFTPQKTAFPPDRTGETYLPRSAPEKQGVPSAFAEEMIRRLHADPGCNMHRLMIARNGHIIASCGFGPYEEDLWHVTYSMCKSVTGLAVGLLIDEGKLSPDDRLGDFIELPRTGLGILLGPKKYQTEDITVRQLLSMKADAVFSESGAISGNQWTVSYMESGCTYEPGATFEYNSMNSYMLSAIVTKITGMTMMEYIRPRLLEPMGITRALWEVSPEQINKGGWGMYLRIEDMVKFGQLYLQHGVWEGRQLVSRVFIDEALRVQAETGRASAPYYGYHVWISETRPGAFALNGMLGQDVFCFPDLNLIVATTAGNDDLFQQSAMARIIKDMAAEAKGIAPEPLPEDAAAYASLTALIRSLEPDASVVPGGGWQHARIPVQTGSVRKRVLHSGRKHPLMRVAHGKNTMTSLDRFVANSLNGASYGTDVKNVGLLPLLIQIVQNNFTDGIDRIGFYLDRTGVFYVTFREGEAVYELPCAFHTASEAVTIDVHGERYQVRTEAETFFDDTDSLTLRLKITFPEEAAVRLVCFVFDNTRYQRERIRTIPEQEPPVLRAAFDETPGTDMMMETLKRMTDDASSRGVLMSTLDNTGAIGALSGRMKLTIKPVLTLTRI